MQTLALFWAGLQKLDSLIATEVGHVRNGMRTDGDVHTSRLVTSGSFAGWEQAQVRRLRLARG